MALIAAVFIVGIFVGQGKIQLGAGAKYRQSVQNNLPENLDYLATEELYDSLKEGFDGQLDAQKLEDGIKKGLVRAAGDPFTEYLNADDAKEFDSELNGLFEGIGAELGKDENQNIIIVTPISGTPAEKAGLRPKDIIAEINGESAFEITIDAAKNKIRGPKGTNVKLKIVREGKVQEVDIVRDIITIPSVTTETVADNIGVIKIARFDNTTVNLVRTAAEKFKTANVKGIILDLRGNPGGTLEASVEVSSLWLKDKTVLEEKRGGKIIKTLKSKGTSTLLGMKTAVLINEGSASASEITAGALRDHGAATLFGAKSFGKGSVQEVRPLKDGDVLKITIAHWFTPSGKNIDKEGIEPDHKVERSEEDFKAGRDSQKQAAIDFLKK